MAGVAELAPLTGTAAACRALAVPLATWYRDRQRQIGTPAPRPRPAPKRALSSEERQHLLDVLHSEPFVDKSPYEVYAGLLDADDYLCSVRTMYRVLEAEGEVRERRNQLRHPKHKKPELLAEGPNEVWSWDITKLLGPAKWTYFYLYVIMDIFSRYVVGWMVAERETAELAKRLIAETCDKQAVDPDQLIIHADNGSQMKAKSVALLMADLGVTKSHSRPYVSNDNPFSEAHFKTLKYRPDFPDRFGSVQHARVHFRSFFPWYNSDHYHTGLGLLTPEAVHYGLAEKIVGQRQRVLNAAYAAHPERFVHRAPNALEPPSQVWINPPSPVLTPASEEVLQ